jgi:hypothetical protein
MRKSLVPGLLIAGMITTCAWSAATNYTFPASFTANPHGPWSLKYGTNPSSMMNMTNAGTAKWNTAGARPSYGEFAQEFRLVDRYAYNNAYLVFTCPQNGKYSLDFNIQVTMQTLWNPGLSTYIEVYTSSIGGTGLPVISSALWSHTRVWNGQGSVSFDLKTIPQLQELPLLSGERIIIRFGMQNVNNWNECVMAITRSGSTPDIAPGIRFNDFVSVRNPLLPDRFVTVQDGHFFYNGKRIRFWGTNFVNTVKQQLGDIELMFDRLVDAGFNAVRLNIFEPTFLEGQTQDTWHIRSTSIGDTGAMGRLDYAIYQAKQKGMFFYITLNKYDSLPEGDYDVLPDDGYRAEWVNMVSNLSFLDLVYLDERCQAVQTAYCKALINHVNPYTGKTYADEEAIALYELFNENCFLTNFTPQYTNQGTLWNALPAYVKENVRVKWNDWLVRKYGNQTNVYNAWKVGSVSNMYAGETLASLNIHFNNGPQHTGQRPRDIMEFNTWLYNDYNQRLIAELRALGTPGRGINVVPITPTGVYSTPLIRYYGAQITGDFTATSNYALAVKKSATPVPFLSRLKAHPVFESPMDIVRVKDKPFVIYETNDYRPNAYGVEYPIRVAAQMAWQDADGVFWFCWDDQYFHPAFHRDTDYSTSALPMPTMSFPNAGLFLANDEVQLAALKSAGALFRNGNLPAAANPFVWTIGKDRLFDPTNPPPTWYTEETWLRCRAWREGLQIVFDPSVNSSPVPGASLGTYAQQGDHVRYDWANVKPGTLTITAPTTKAMVGFFGPNATIGDTTLSNIDQNFSSVVITSDDGLPLAESNNVVITMVRDSTNTDYFFNTNNLLGTINPVELARGLSDPDGTPGTSPPVFQRVSGTISASWMAGMKYKKYRFDRGCYEEGQLDTVVPVLTIKPNEPLFYVQLYREVYTPGDANLDGRVDVGDLGILAANYGGSGKTWEQGDFNGDGKVDVGDLGILAAHYGEGTNTALDFNTDYTQAFGTSEINEAAMKDDEVNSMCSNLGLPIIAGLMLLMGLMLMKNEGR